MDLFDYLLDICGGSLTRDSGSLTSPSWPEAHRQAAVCKWVITKPRSERVSYQISQLVLSGSAASCNSYLELHDGPSDTSPIIGKFCSNTGLSPSITTSNQLYVKFVTDGTGSLFKMQYTTRKFSSHIKQGPAFEKPPQRNF